MKILVDNREPDKIINYLKLFKVEVILSQLNVGDYIISDKVVIERKSGSDFIQSIYDQRLFKQVNNMMEEFERVFIIVEGFEPDEGELKHVYGAMSYLTINRSIPIISTNNHIETAALLERICSWIQEDHVDPILSRTGPRRMTTEEKQLFLIQGLEGCGIKTANLLLENYDSPLDIFNEIKNTEILYTKGGKPKGISGKLATIKGIGHKFVSKNKEIL